MNLRGKLFCSWALLTLLVWLGAFWTAQETVESSYRQRASDAFTRTKQTLDTMREQRIDQMRQACSLVMQIPELRALIVEQSYEFNVAYAASLRERLDYLSKVIDADFIAALNIDGDIITHGGSISADELEPFDQYLHESEPAQNLLAANFRVNGASKEAGLNHGIGGLWAVGGNLYYVVGVPLLFQQDGADAAGHVQGALLVGSKLTDEFAAELGRSQDCEVIFFTQQSVAASSMVGPERDNLITTVKLHAPKRAAASTTPFVTHVGDERRLTLSELLKDPASGAAVGVMTIQGSLEDSAQFLAALSWKLLVIMSCGLCLAAAGSFLLSTMVTHPIGRLLHAVRHVATGDLQQEIPIKRRDELGELAEAFNDMVRQLQTRQTLSAA